MSIRPFDNRDGFTKFHNYTLDHIMPVLPPNAWKVLCLIIRKTTGWRKDEEHLSYSEIKQGTGIKSDATLSAALKELLMLQYVCVDSGRQWDANVYSLNTEFEIEPPTTETEVEPTTETEVEPTTETEVEPTTETEVYKRKGSKDKTTKEKRKEKNLTNQPVSRSLIGANGLVGFYLPEQGQFKGPLPTEEETATAIQATAAVPPSSEAPPTVADVDRSVALLTDPDVGMSRNNAARFAGEYEFPWLVAQVADWWEDRRMGKADTVGALYNRIRKEFSIVGMSDAFLRSDLYARHYPLDLERAESWAWWERNKAMAEIAIGINIPLGLDEWLASLTADERALLAALPVPVAVREYAEVLE